MMSFYPFKNVNAERISLSQAILVLREALLAEKVGCFGGGAPGRRQEHRRAAEGEGGGFARRLQAALQLRRPEAGLAFGRRLKYVAMCSGGGKNLSKRLYGGS